jgi:hypothetical protein
LRKVMEGGKEERLRVECEGPKFEAQVEAAGLVEWGGEGRRVDELETEVEVMKRNRALALSA